MNNIVTIENFQMKFGKKIVIENLSFAVKEGEVFGFLGSNGSGKTTTIRALLGIYQPSKGSLLINGQPFSPALSGFLGYLPEERGLYKKENVLDTMCYFGRLKNMTFEHAKQWSLAYLERVELTDKANQRIDTLSGGQQQKVQLGITIMNNPKLLILDEPTKGFDPVNRRLMMDIIEERRAKGATIILVTHQMEEVERLCERIVLLKDGARRLYGSVDEIKKEYGSSQIAIQFKGKFEPDHAVYSVQNQTSTTAQIVAKATTQEVFQSLASQKNLEIISFDLQQSSLDDIFVNIYQNDNHSTHA